MPPSFRLPSRRWSRDAAAPVRAQRGDRFVVRRTRRAAVGAERLLRLRQHHHQRGVVSPRRQPTTRTSGRTAACTSASDRIRTSRTSRSIRPSIAFMLDIRRDNLLEHLLFKSLFAMSRNRLEYLCLLFGKRVPAGHRQMDRPTDPGVDRLPRRNAHRLRRRGGDAPSEQRADHGLRRSARRARPRDDRSLPRRSSSPKGSTPATRASDATIGATTRRSASSFSSRIGPANRSATSPTNRPSSTCARCRRANRIVPVIGNVAGTKAVRAIGAYAAEHGLVVSAFYLSNVEQYLMGRDGGFDAYAQNVKALPHDSHERDHPQLLRTTRHAASALRARRPATSARR